MCAVEVQRFSLFRFLQSSKPRWNFWTMHICTFAHDKVHKLDKLSYTESPVLWQSKRILKRTGKEEGRRRRGSMLVAGGN